MYLSRIQLTDNILEGSQLGRVLQKNSYGMHSLLWDLFEKGERFLFREENSKDQLQTVNNRPLYYVLSQQEPEQSSPLFNIQTKSFIPVLKIGDVLSFKLRANPTVSRRVEGKRLSQRHDILMDAQRQWLLSACQERDIDPGALHKSDMKQLLLKHSDFNSPKGSKAFDVALKNAMDQAAKQWLQSRGDKHGFAVQSVQSTGYRWHALPEKHRQAGFSSMDYDGVLTVTAPDIFIQSLKSGLGPAKAFGCGLMLIRRH